MKKKIIHTCDDFGLHSSINEAVLETYENNMLSGASIVPSGRAVEDAISIAKICKSLNIGLHFTLIEEFPISNPTQITSLLAKDGKFFKNYKEFILKFILGKIDQEHIQIELENQILFLKNQGIKINYLDSHQHLHMFPLIFDIILPILKKYEIYFIRCVKTPFFAKDLKKPIPLSASFIFDLMKFYFHIKKMIIPDYFIGLFHSGNIGLIDVLQWSQQMKKEAIYEIGFHLGKSDRELNQIYSHWQQPFSWEKEFKIINHPQYKEQIKQQNISLIKYSDLSK